MATEFIALPNLVIDVFLQVSHSPHFSDENHVHFFFEKSGALPIQANSLLSLFFGAIAITDICG